MGKTFICFLKINFLFFLILITNISCKQISNSNSNNICLIGSLTYNSAIGYGNIYTCKIKEIKEGNIKSNNIYITIISKKYDDYINTHLNPKLVEINFNKKDEHEPYSKMPINGFVDEQMTSYEITSIK